MDRRSFLKAGALSVVGGTAAFGVPLLGRGSGVLAKDASDLSGSDFPSRFSVPLPQHVRIRPGPDGIYDLTAKAGSAQILTNDMRTPVVGYNGIFPGPLLEVERGVPARVRIRNHLPREGGIGGTPYAISTHLHGSASLPEYDGYASDTTPVGFMKTYEYPNHQPARTMWYHDHGQHWTAQNAYSGLAAMYIVHDDNERALLPQGEFDVPLIVNDMMFDSDGALAYDDNSHSGLSGDVICVNGRPLPVMKVKRRTYRFRMLNASIARSYRWQLSSSALQFQVVATDGGLMPKGIGTTTIRHGGAERYEFIIDFSKLPSTVRIVELRNRSNENNVDYDYTGLVMRFDVTDEPFDQDDWTWNANYVGMELDPHNEVMAVSESQVTARRNLRVQRSDLTNQWTINEKAWEDVLNSGYTDTVAKVPRGNAVELWRIENRSGGWFHPVHI